MTVTPSWMLPSPAAGSTWPPLDRVKLVVAIVLLALISACASDSNETVDDAPPVSTSRDGTEAPDTSSSATVEPDDQSLAGVTGELIINRQRDLIDRGLINALVHNDSSDPLTIDDRGLVSTFFDTPQADPRHTTIPAGRQVALQVPYGVTTDCTDPSSVDSRLVMSLDTGEQVQIALGGTDILDGIRTKQCTGQAFDAQTDTAFTDVVVNGETVSATLVIARDPNATDTDDLELRRVNGTILVGVNRAGSDIDVQAFDDLAADADEVELPLRFVVNRCDPHALAEVTKRLGLDLEVAINGGDAIPVPIDVSPLATDLEGIVQLCRDRTGDDG